MNAKKIIIFVVLIGVLGAGAYYYAMNKKEPIPGTGEAGYPSPPSGGEEAIVAVRVESQKPGMTVLVKEATLPAAGFLVIHADAGGGRPGGVTAASALVAKGMAVDVSIAQPAELKAGQSYFIMPHRDDGDGVFVFAEDLPFTNEKGELLLFPFAVGE